MAGPRAPRLRIWRGWVRTGGWRPTRRWLRVPARAVGAARYGHHVVVVLGGGQLLRYDATTHELVASRRLAGPVSRVEFLPAVVAIHRPLRPLLYSPTTLRALSDR